MRIWREVSRDSMEVFTYRQYSKKTLAGIHSALLKSGKRMTTEQQNQFQRVREEMERRGMKLTNYKKP